MLAALLCIQCSHSVTGDNSSVVIGAVSTQPAESAGRVARLEELARTDHVALLERAVERTRETVHSYRCVFTKQERISGRLRPTQKIEAAVIEEDPYAVCLKWIENAPIGDQVLYVEGKYNDQMLVRPKGLLNALVGTQRRDPTSPQVMANTLNPVTGFGLRRTLESLLEVYRLAEDRGEGISRFVGYVTVNGRKAFKLERVLPEREDYPTKTTTWYLDVERLIPLGLEGTDWNDQLRCAYFFHDVEMNVGLTEEDFTPEACGFSPVKK
jgi:hypothetical protein